MYDGTMSPADLAAVTGGNRAGDDGLFGGNSWAWIVVLFLFMWGRGGWGMGNGQESGAANKCMRAIERA